MQRLESEQDRLKSKLDAMEQKGLDHCLVIHGIPENANDNKQDCIEKIHIELACTIEANEEEDQ